MKPKAQTYFDKGMAFIKTGLNSKSLIEFKAALVEDYNGVIKALNEKYEQFSLTKEYESALSIGHILLKEKKSDKVLANALGNISRMLGYYENAESLYRIATEIDPEYEYPWFNLAALAVRANIFDQEAVNAGKFLSSDTRFVVPNFVSFATRGEKIEEDPNFYTELRKEITKSADAEKERQIKLLEQKKEDIEKQLSEWSQQTQQKKENDPEKPVDFDFDHKSKQVNLREEVLELEESINTLTDKEIDISGKLLQYFNALLQEAAGKRNKEFMDVILYNKARYYLETHKYIDCLKQLKYINDKKRFKHYKLIYTVAWGMCGKFQEAIDILLSFLSKDPYNRYLLVNIGLFYQQLDSKQLSIKYLVSAKELLDESDGIYDKDDFIKLAHREFHKGNLASASKHYEVLYKEKSINYEINFNYATTLFKSDDNLVLAAKLLKPLCSMTNPFSDRAQDLLRQVEEKLLVQGNHAFGLAAFDKSIEYYMTAYSIKKRINTGKNILRAFSAKDKLDGKELQQQQIITDELAKLSEGG